MTISQIVVGDIHGELDTALKLFKHMGIPTDPTQRAKEGYRTIQVGDLLHLGHGKEEADKARQLLAMFDVVLMGNHEWPLFAPYPAIVAFSGYWRHDKEAAEIVREAWQQGQFRAAYPVGDWLISHAGVHPYWLAKHWGEKQLAAKYLADGLSWRMARYMQYQFKDLRFNGGNPDLTGYYDQKPEDADLFDAISQNRGGWDPYGGMIWGDWDDLVASYQIATDIPQIVGHTIRDDARPELVLVEGQPVLWNIDVGGKYPDRQDLCALATTDNGTTWHSWLIGEGAGTEENGYVPPVSLRFPEVEGD